jgi:hypothetical protein
MSEPVKVLLTKRQSPLINGRKQICHSRLGRRSLTATFTSPTRTKRLLSRLDLTVFIDWISYTWCYKFDAYCIILLLTVLVFWFCQPIPFNSQRCLACATVNEKTTFGMNCRLYFNIIEPFPPLSWRKLEVNPPTPFRCPHTLTIIIRNKFFSPPFLDGRNFLSGGGGGGGWIFSGYFESENQRTGWVQVWECNYFDGHKA